MSDTQQHTTVFFNINVNIDLTFRLKRLAIGAFSLRRNSRRTAATAASAFFPSALQYKSAEDVFF